MANKLIIFNFCASFNDLELVVAFNPLNLYHKAVC